MSSPRLPAELLFLIADFSVHMKVLKALSHTNHALHDYLKPRMKTLRVLDIVADEYPEPLRQLHGTSKTLNLLLDPTWRQCAWCGRVLYTVVPPGYGPGNAARWKEVKRKLRVDAYRTKKWQAVRRIRVAV